LNRNLHGVVNISETGGSISEISNSSISIEIIEEEFYKDKKVNTLSPVDEQCL
jgi:hypothetical protein